MELFAADGHDAGGCERVTGKSGMRPFIEGRIGARLNRIGERGKLDRTGDGNPEQPADFDDAVAEMPRVRDHRQDIGILVGGVPGARSQKHDTEHAIKTRFKANTTDV